MLIDAMVSIGQTCARNGNYGPNGWHELVVIRTDHIGPIRRSIAVSLMWMVSRLARAERDERAKPQRDGHHRRDARVDPVGEAVLDLPIVQVVDSREQYHGCGFARNNDGPVALPMHL